MCSRNGGLFIKVGQHVGALEYLFPPEYVQTFKLFHSEAPQTSLDSIVSVIEEELGQPGMSRFTIHDCLVIGREGDDRRRIL